MKHIIIILSALTLLITSCALFKSPKFERVNSFQLRELGIAQSKMDLSIVVSNPNWYEIQVKNLEVTVLDKSNSRLSDIRLYQPIDIPKHSADTVYLDIDVDTRAVARIISKSANKVEFIVKARADAKVMGIGKHLEIEQPQSVNFTQILAKVLPQIPEDYTIPTIQTGKKKNVKPPAGTTLKAEVVVSPTPPEIFKVMKTSITDIGFKETELTVKFMMFNPFGLTFTLNDFPAEVWINDKHAGTGNLGKPISFDENVQYREGEIVFNLKNFNSILIAFKGITSRELNYKVNGTLLAEGFGAKISKPFHFNGTVVIGSK